jgi:hypothetical protein
MPFYFLTAQGMLSIAVVTAWIFLTSPLAAEATKVTMCHRSKCDPAKFKTIQVRERDVAKRLEKGDLLGPCNESCGILCDDMNNCTVDNDQFDCEENGCTPSANRTVVPCEDGLQICNVTLGYCVNPCDDGIACTDDFPF